MEDKHQPESRFYDCEPSCSYWPTLTDEEDEEAAEYECSNRTKSFAETRKYHVEATNPFYDCEPSCSYWPTLTDEEHEEAAEYECSNRTKSFAETRKYHVEATNPFDNCEPSCSSWSTFTEEETAEYECSDRTKALAQPRKYHVEAAALRLEQLGQVSPTALVAKCSERIKELAEPKVEPMERRLNNYVHAESHDDPPYPSKHLSARLKKLAKPKDYSSSHRAVGLPIPVSIPALTAIASPRIGELAEPVIRPALKATKDKVSKKALNYVASHRICDLAKAKKPRLEPKIELPRPVTSAALQYNASPRILQLAVSKPGYTYEQLLRDTSRFQVRRSALVAKCSKRTRALAKPLNR